MSDPAERPGYYGILPASVRYDDGITPNAKILYSEITCLSNKCGYCYASNNYFAALYKVTPQAVSKWINSLADRGYIRIEYIRSGKEIVERKLYVDVSTNIDRVSTNVDGGINICLTGYQQKIKGNNTSNNITSINNTEAVAKETHHRYGPDNNVLLTDSEVAALKEKTGTSTLYDDVIEFYSLYKSEKGYKCKKDYNAIVRWVIKAVKERKERETCVAKTRSAVPSWDQGGPGLIADME